MKDLLVTSYKAQCKWLEPRILSIKTKSSFNTISNMIITMVNNYDWSHEEIVDELSSNYASEGFGMAYDLYLETYENLNARFNTGIPLETWSIVN